MNSTTIGSEKRNSAPLEPTTLSTQISRGSRVERTSRASAPRAVEQPVTLAENHCHESRPMTMNRT